MDESMNSTVYTTWSVKRPQTAGSCRKLARAQQKLLSSGLPSLLERLLIETFVHAVRALPSPHYLLPLPS